MNKAFIFDPDGVLINNEALWEQRKAELYPKLFGPEVCAKLGSTLGVNLDEIYERGTKLGATITKSDFLDAFFKTATNIYRQAPLSNGISELADVLGDLGFALAIVSASPEAWMQAVVYRLSLKTKSVCSSLCTTSPTCGINRIPTGT